MKIIFLLIGLIAYSFFSFAQGEDSLFVSTSETNAIGLNQYDEAIAFYKQVNDSAQLAASYEKKAELLADRSAAAAIAYYEKAYDIHYQLGHLEATVRLSELLSNAYYDNQEYNKSLIRCYPLLQYYEQKKDGLKLAQIHSLMGSIYDDMHNQDLSYGHQKIALDLSIQLNSKRGIAAISNNISGLFAEMDSFDLALDYVRQAEIINKEMGNEYWLNINYMQMSDIYDEQGKYDSSRYYLFKSKEYIEENGSRTDSLFLIRKLGIYYYHVNNIPLAIQYFNKGILLSREMGNISAEANFIHWLSEVADNQGEEGLAFTYLQQYYDLRDSLTEQKTRQDLVAFQVLYDVSELENELSVSVMEQQIAAREVEKMNIRFFGLLIISVLIVVFGVIFYVQYRKQYQSNKYLLNLNMALSNNELKLTDKYASSNLKDDQKNKILAAFVSLIADDEIFKDQELKLDTVATQLGVSRTYLSQVINETYDQNFNAYINSYRINLSKQYLVSPEYMHYSIQGIAETVGFKSLSAFNVAFKKFTGLTPSYYRKNAGAKR